MRCERKSCFKGIVALRVESGGFLCVRFCFCLFFQKGTSAENGPLKLYAGNPWRNPLDFTYPIEG